MKRLCWTVLGAPETGGASLILIPAGAAAQAHGTLVGVSAASHILHNVYMMSDNAHDHKSTNGSNEENIDEDGITNGGKKKLGNLTDMQDMEIGEGILKRGGNGSNVNKIASWLRGKKIKEIANLAARGNQEAEEAIKILKQAKQKGQKY